MTTVLVVDDSELTHSLLRSALTRAGYVTVHAMNADEALSLLPDQPVDALVVDIAMPNMDGIQLAQLLRSRDDVDPSLPVVFYSAYINDSNARDRVAGVQPATIIAKDGNVASLVQALTNVINAHAVAKSATPPAAVIIHVGEGLVAISVEKNGSTVYELRRGAKVLFDAPSVEQLINRATTAGLA